MKLSLVGAVPGGTSNGVNTSLAGSSTTAEQDAGAPILAITDASTGSNVYARQSTIQLAINQDDSAAQWCVSEALTTAPASGSDSCVGGSGPLNGWYVTRPTSFSLSGPDGRKTVRLWLADGNGNVLTGSGMASITLDTAAPTSPIATLSDPGTGSMVATAQSNVNLSIFPNADVAQWCVIEQASSDPSPAAPTFNSGCAWLSARPTAQSLSTLGPRTVYVYAQDAAGNVSAAGTASIEYTAIGAFSISGVQGGKDSVADIWLTDNVNPQLSWNDASGEASYDVTIYESDGTTVKCATANVPANSTSYAFSGCSLANGTTYKARVIAKNGADQRDADNSPFTFTAYFSPTDASLVAAYGFEEGAGTTTADTSSYGNTATRSGASWTTSGKFGNGMSFNGSSDYVAAPDAAQLHLTNGLTVMAWVYPTASMSGSFVPAVSKDTSNGSVQNDGYYLLANSNYQSDTPVGEGYVSGHDWVITQGSSQLPLNQWSHLAMTYDGSSMALYLNGSFVGSSVLQGAIAEASTSLFIGASLALGPSYFKGKIDEVRIYNRALAATEIQQDMNAPIVPSGGPGPFLITGITGGGDALADDQLTDGSTATLHWVAAVGAVSYQATIYENDGVTIKCPQVSISALQYAFSSCALSPSTYYRAKVAALGSNGQATQASNGLYSFYTGILVKPAYPFYGANWNDYIAKSSGAAPAYGQVDSPCMGTACIHGGEVRKLVLPLASCAGLSASDSLGAFDWVCDSVSGAAVFYSTGLKSGKGLADLVNATSWKSDGVTVSNGGGALYATASTAWWSNPVQALPANGGGSVATLSATSTIYTLASSATSRGYYITANKVGLVTLAGATLSYDGTAANNCREDYGNTASIDGRCLVFASGQQNLWIEGTFDAQAANRANLGFSLGWMDYSTLRNVTIQHASSHGINLMQPFGDSFVNVSSSSNGGNGVNVEVGGSGDDLSAYDSWNGLAVSQNTGIGFYTNGWAGNCASSHMDLTNVTAKSNGSHGVYLRYSCQITVSNSLLDSNGGDGLGDETGSSNVYKSIAVSRNTGDGITPFWGTDARLYDVIAAYNGECGINMQVPGSVVQSRAYGNASCGVQAGSDDILSRVIATNNSNSGITVNSDSTLQFVTAADNDSAADGVAVTASHVTLANAVLANQGVGLSVQNFGFSGSGLFRKLALVNDDTGIYQNYASQNAFDDFLLIGGNGVNCSDANAQAQSGIADGTCTTTGTDGSSAYPGGDLSNAVLRTGRNASASFMGKVTVTDPSNASNTTGTETYASLTDWTDFSSIFRAWGPDGSAYPNGDNRGTCTSGTCRIWDWSLSSLDSTLLNRSGDGNAANSAFVDGAVCPTEVNGGVTVTDQQGTPHTFLANAFELVEDPVHNPTGNNNGLCESGEACVYAPNIGAYQGDGDPTAHRCIFSNGVVSAVTMYGYPNNGSP